MRTFVMTAAAIALGLGTCTAALAADKAAPRSRAEVIAELKAAQASGWMAAMMGEDSGSAYLSRQTWVPTRTRAEVVAELDAARASGELAELSSEMGGVSYAQAQPATVVTRAQVREELRLARASGEMAILETEGGESALPRHAAVHAAPLRYVGPGREAPPATLAALAGGKP